MASSARRTSCNYGGRTVDPEVAFALLTDASAAREDRQQAGYDLHDWLLVDGLVPDALRRSLGDVHPYAIRSAAMTFVDELTDSLG